MPLICFGKKQKKILSPLPPPSLPAGALGCEMRQTPASSTLRKHLDNVGINGLADAAGMMSDLGQAEMAQQATGAARRLVKFPVTVLFLSSAGVWISQSVIIEISERVISIYTCVVRFSNRTGFFRLGVVVVIVIKLMFDCVRCARMSQMLFFPVGPSYTFGKWLTLVFFYVVICTSN